MNKESENTFTTIECICEFCSKGRKLLAAYSVAIRNCPKCNGELKPSSKRTLESLRTPKDIIDWLIMHHEDAWKQLSIYADDRHDEKKISDDVYNSYMEEVDKHRDSVNLFKKLSEALK